MHQEVEFPQTFGKTFWIMLAIGWMMMAIGLRLFLVNARANAPRYSVVLAVGSNIAQDAIFTPVVSVVVWLGHRFLPRRLHGPAAWAFFGSIVVLLVAAVPIHRNNDHGYNATILDRNYTHSALIIIAVLWSISALWTLLSLLVGRLRRNV